MADAADGLLRPFATFTSIMVRVAKALLHPIFRGCGSRVRWPPRMWRPSWLRDEAPTGRSGLATPRRAPLPLVARVAGRRASFGVGSLLIATVALSSCGSDRDDSVPFVIQWLGDEAQTDWPAPPWFEERTELSVCPDLTDRDLSGNTDCFSAAVQEGRPVEVRVVSLHAGADSSLKWFRQLPDGTVEVYVRNFETGVCCGGSPTSFWTRLECDHVFIDDRGLPSTFDFDGTDDPGCTEVNEATIPVEVSEGDLERLRLSYECLGARDGWSNGC